MSQAISILFLILAFKAACGYNVTYDDIIEVTIDIVSSCLMKTKRDTVLLGGEYSEFLTKEFFHAHTVALIADSKYNAFKMFTLSRHSFHIYENYRFLRFLVKLHRFVVVASSQPILRLTLQKILDSTWSNSEGLHVLIDKKTERNGCKNAYAFLWAAWEFNLISSVFLCVDPVDGFVLYTYNPYSNDIPEVWQEAERFKGRRRHPWILLKRKYVPGKQTCKDLYFDKTVTLNGYEIRLNAVSMEPLLKIDLKKPGLQKFSGDNGEIVKILFQKLEASVRVTVYNDTIYALGSVGKGGELTGMLGDLSNGREDMGMNTRSLFVMWKLRYTYPHADSGLCAVTQKTGYLSELKKLVTFLSPEVIVGIYIICVITHAILTKHEGFILAGLNVVRLIICVSLRRPPKASSTRIYLCMVFILFLIIDAVFESHWSSLLTVPVPYKNIDTLEDLKKAGYHIYGAEALEHWLADPDLKERFNGASYDGCREHVDNDSYAACVGDCFHLYERMRGATKELHHSKKIRNLVHTYVTRENWPLFKRVSDLIQRTVEAGLVIMWRNQAVEEFFRKRRINRPKKHDYRVLVLDHLGFSFYILATGYLIATVVFVIELKLGRRSAKCKTCRTACSRICSKRKRARRKRCARRENQVMLMPWIP